MNGLTFAQLGIIFATLFVVLFLPLVILQRKGWRISELKRDDIIFSAIFALLGLSLSVGIAFNPVVLLFLWAPIVLFLVFDAVFGSISFVKKHNAQLQDDPYDLPYYEDEAAVLGVSSNKTDNSPLDATVPTGAANDLACGHPLQEEVVAGGNNLPLPITEAAEKSMRDGRPGLVTIDLNDPSFSDQSNLPPCVEQALAEGKKTLTVEIFTTEIPAKN